MEKTTNLRMGSYFHSVDKACHAAQTRQLNAEELQNLRYATSRILQLLLSQDKSVRLAILKVPSYVQSLTLMLELFCKDIDILRNAIAMFGELIGRTGSNKHCASLVSGGLTQVLFLVMRDTKLEMPCDVVADLHSLLYKLGMRDKKRFGVKARLGQVLPITLGFLRANGHSVRITQPALSVLKLYCLSTVNAAYLSKSGAVSILFRVLNTASRKSTILLKTALDTLVLLVKSRSSAARAVNHDGVALLLRMHCEWQRLDTKNRHVGLRKAILSALRHITDLKAGRRSFLAANGVRALYRTCQEIMDIRELESLILAASGILRKCLPKHRLPASTNRSALLYPLPSSELYPQLVSHSMASRAQTSLSGYGERLDDVCDSYSSSDEDDGNGDASSGDDVDLDTRKNESDDDRGDALPPVPTPRTLDDLLMYDVFFPELTENGVLASREGGPESFRPASAYTGGSPHTDRSARRRLPPLSLPAIPTAARAAASPNGTSYSRGHEARDRLIVSPVLPPRRLPSSTSAPSSLRSLGMYGTGSQDDSHLLSSLVSNRDSACAAVNTKTGLPVFSLDLPMWSRTATGRVAAMQASRSRSPATMWHPASLSSVNDAIEADTGRSSANDHDCGSHTACRTTVAEYLELAHSTLGVGPFSKVAFPDLHGHEPPPYTEPLYERRFGVQRAKIFEDIDRMIEPESLINRIVYDLDAILKDDVGSHGKTGGYDGLTLQNDDLHRIRKRQHPHEFLYFNARFESGNLRKAIQVREHEYDLILCPDVNTNHHHQWFYFEVGNMKAGVPYRFSIINNEKASSQFSFGMQPVMFSVCEAAEGRAHWLRTGSDVCYYKNHFARSARVTGGVRGKLYFTTSFTIRFPHSYDVCYLAYHYPYTYTTLQAHVKAWERSYDCSSTFFRHQELCQTVRENSVPLLTVTARDTRGTAAGEPSSQDTSSAENPTGGRPYVFLSARVHPGESNASWIMKGIVDYLLSDVPSARALREAYVFKIVPMLNPDGVIAGNHRLSLAGDDLNRRWLTTCPVLHPSVYHTKGLLQHMRFNLGLPLHVFCDLHGHSLRKNVFLYGCSPSMTWVTDDKNNPAVVVSGSQRLEDGSYKILPRALAAMAPAFSLTNCSYAVEKSKEGTARVVVWRHLGVVRSYTMESTYCGCDQGPYKGLQIGTRHLEEMGQQFAEALLKVKYRTCRSSTAAAAYGAVPANEAGLCDLMRLATTLDESLGSVDLPLGATCEESHIITKEDSFDKSDSEDTESQPDNDSDCSSSYTDYYQYPSPRDSDDGDLAAQPL